MYNAEEFIGECIQSVLAQSRDDWELLIVDDGSTDESAKIVETFALGDKRIRLLAHPDGANLGVSSSRQLGVRAARGRYIAFLDADDAFEANKLETQILAMDGSPDCVMCHTGITVISGSGESLDNTSAEVFNRVSDDLRKYALREYGHFLVRNPVCNSTTLVRADVLQRIAFAFPQRFQSEDLTLWVLLSTMGPFLFLPDRLTRFRWHDKSATAAVMKNRLQQTYTKVELLLSLIALCDDRTIVQAARTRLCETLSSLVNTYQEYAPPTRQARVDWFGDDERAVGSSIWRSIAGWMSKVTNTCRGMLSVGKRRIVGRRGSNSSCRANR